MEICTTKAAIRAQRQDWRNQGRRVVLVPTMGYLHEGHMSLVRAARANAGPEGRVIASIFVNPTQFGANEDLSTYPRDPERDTAMLRDAGVDALFIPEVSEVYAPNAQTIVDTSELSRILIGKLRPGHFRGVATVVTKLFNIIQPEAACFGEKDYQQLAVIRTMVRDLDIPVDVIGVPTVREADGLAMSSRNIRLTPADRAAAPVLNAALTEAEALAAEGTTASRIRSHVRARLDGEARADVQSVDIRDAETLAALSGPLAAPAVLLLAVRFGTVLLIDNRVLAPPPHSKEESP
ncbi:pantoate--beta-alanine ligase [Rhodobacteraceae bacterium 2376]|uniref:Pantothenate synthetase n=1 Tax=Rhabdonatronobacter sediminivivens TaxID=2743469 RepID=A0A7Z0I1L6_9RHOB|nr:pantoate--beta-alanine ligase [Rhabdonatronobacter sediminivivens]NYS26277.1 pantoate--beta-alanine ligase [Rhabdonatronobacter sediminivivens]